MPTPKSDPQSLGPKAVEPKDTSDCEATSSGSRVSRGDMVPGRLYFAYQLPEVVVSEVAKFVPSDVENFALITTSSFKADPTVPDTPPNTKSIPKRKQKP